MPILSFSVFEKDKIKNELKKGSGYFVHYTDGKTYSIQIVISNDLKFSNDDLFPLIFNLKEQK